MQDLRWALLIIGGLIILGIYVLSLRDARRRGKDDAPTRKTPTISEMDAPEMMETISVGHAGDEPLTDAGVQAELRSMGALLAEKKLDQFAPVPSKSEHGPEDIPKLPTRRESPEPEPDSAPSTGAAQHELIFSPQPPPTPPKRKGWKLFGGAPEPEPEPVELPELLLVIHVVALPTRYFDGQDIQNALRQAGLKHGHMDIYHRIPHGRIPHGNGDQDAVFSVADMLEPGALGDERLQEHQTSGLTLFLRLPGPVDGQTALDEMLSAARGLAQRLSGEIHDERRSVLTRQTVEHMRERIIEHRRQRELAQRRAHGVPQNQ